MKDIAISAEGLGKRYRIGALARQTTMGERLTHALKAPARWLGSKNGNGAGGHRDFWALRDVSLELRRGEVVGLIGRNGAGKSTLLKILSRVTVPTLGRAEIHGRVGSLLEVGTGFHPELTGRENTYLNGAILGMGRREIDRKFDEIVAFSEVGEFIDTPLKHYSSGMQMRLAFAVAAHLEPETLLVDEVLAVGDMAFQKKCLGKMGEVASGGRTIVFVSHQINQIRRLCEKVIWLDQGTIYRTGPTAEVTGAYEASMSRRADDVNDSGKAPEVRHGFVGWEIVTPRAQNPSLLTTAGPFSVKFTLRLSKPVSDGNHGIALYNQERQLIWGWSKNHLQLDEGTHEFHYSFPAMPLRPGLYNWLVSLYDHGNQVDTWSCVPEMNVATPIHQDLRDEWNGILNVPCEFSTSHGVVHV
ncbi:MAG TPA: polysaccharide ABC transporter ATP-binding protein [Bryobacteraceae bacterium]|nr:polysaccharide ABC transporter ATP-binding protein [Bryobacteraceae bacterium]